MAMQTATEEYRENVSAGRDLAQSTVCLKVEFGLLGNSRKVPTSAVEVDADKSQIRVSKQLLESKRLEDIRKADGELRRYLYDICLPFDIGVHLVSLAAVEQVRNRLVEYKLERSVLVDAFLNDYEILKGAAAGRLRTLYNPDDYPDVEDVRAKFSFSWRLLYFGVPDSLKSISQQVWDEEREKAAKDLDNAAVEVRELMRESLAQLVGHLRDRLTPDEKGKTRILRDSAVTNLSEFLANFDLRNVTNDGELREQVERARAILRAVPDVDVLRNVSSLRERVRADMAQIGASLGALVTSRPSRKIRLE